MIGIDTVSIARIAAAIANEAFLTRVFTERERNYCDRKSHVAQSYAGIFSAKEAAVKAIESGFGRGIMPCDIEIDHKANGAPFLRAFGKAQEIFGKYKSYVSISHDGDNAVAVVELVEIDR